MITVSITQFRREMSKLLQRVRDEGETIEITVRGEPVAHVVSVRPKAIASESDSTN